MIRGAVLALLLAAGPGADPAAAPESADAAAAARTIDRTVPEERADAGSAAARDGAPAPRADPPPPDASEQPLEPLWSTGPRWLFGVIAGIVALFLWATCTPIVRGRDPWLAGIRTVIPLGIAALGSWILFGSRTSLPLAAGLAVALVGARRALGPARRPEDARAPGPVGWLGDVAFEIASFLVMLVVQLVVDLFVGALLGAIFGRGAGGGGSGRGAGRGAGGAWGGGGGVFSGGGASGRW